MTRCRCTNVEHGHGPKCEREATEPGDLCEDCLRKAAMEWPLGQPPETPIDVK